LDNYEVFIFKIPHYPSLMPSTCQCHINYQLSQNLQDLHPFLPIDSFDSITIFKSLPLYFTLHDGPLLQISSPPPMVPSSSSIESVTPFSLYLYSSFPILALFFPCQLIQATHIQEDIIELSLFSEHKEKKYYWVREEKHVEENEGGEKEEQKEIINEKEEGENEEGEIRTKERMKKDMKEQEKFKTLKSEGLDTFNNFSSSSLSSSSIVKIYSEYRETSSASSFIFSTSDIVLIKKDHQQTVLLGTRRKTLLWMDSSQMTLHHTLLLPHIPMEM